MTSLGHPCKFQRVSRLDSVTARQSSSEHQPNFVALNRGANYVLQGDHHAGHWPTFLVTSTFSVFLSYATVELLFISLQGLIVDVTLAVSHTSEVNSNFV